MRNRNIINPSVRVRGVLAAMAWATVAWIGVGYVSEVPSVSAWIDSATQSTVGRFIEGALLAAAAATLIGLWVSAVWYALITTPTRSARRLVLATVLIAGNIAAAFIYYFAYVAWRPVSLPQAEASANGHAV